MKTFEQAFEAISGRKMPVSVRRNLKTLNQVWASMSARKIDANRQRVRARKSKRNSVSKKSTVSD